MISIITPFKNTAAYLPECIQSIQNQSEQNWELIAVNDHSEDESEEVVARFAMSDPRIKLFTNEGTGIIDALKTAFDNSSGSFVTRMDSDDRMHPEKLTTLKSNLVRNGKGTLAIGPVQYFADFPIGEGYFKYEKWLNKLTQKGSNYSEIYKECVVPSPSWMCHRADFIRCGAFNGEDYPEDYELTFRFYKHRLRVIPETKILHYWRDYPKRTSRTHPNYANNTFLDLKLKYFLRLDFDQGRPLLIWGAGTKGKQIARTLLREGVKFDWICENPNKIGKEIYGCEMLPISGISNWNSYQSIITVANPIEQQKIKASLKNEGLAPLKDYFFFC